MNGWIYVYAVLALLGMFTWAAYAWLAAEPEATERVEGVFPLPSVRNVEPHRTMVNPAEFEGWPAYAPRAAP